MEIYSGKHEGKTSQIVVLNHPDYVQWYRANQSKAALCKQFEAHVSRMDSKPFVVTCGGCKGPATRATAYANNFLLMFWCEDCDPYSHGANRGKLTVIRTYDDSVRHIEDTAESHKGYMKNIVRELAYAKGLPKRVGKVHAEYFFN